GLAHHVPHGARQRRRAIRLELHCAPSPGRGGCPMKQWQSHLIRILEDSFRAGGVRKAARAARFAIHTLVAGRNPSQASKCRMPEKVAPSTFSDWLSAMDWKSFIAGVNRWSRTNVKALLRHHPPDARGCVNIADVHQVEYDPDWPGRWRKTS